MSAERCAAGGVRGKNVVVGGAGAAGPVPRCWAYVAAFLGELVHVVWCWYFSGGGFSLTLSIFWPPFSRTA